MSGLAAVSTMLFASIPGWAAPIDDAKKTEVRITADGAVLAATLYRPKGAEGDIPAVVVGHGSGPVTRENSFWTNAALSTGLAALVYDKRGAGASTGTQLEWELEKTPEMFQTLAGDMIYAARWLANQRGIDRDRVGLMGGSQAGWIMPLAASREPIVKFVIVGEGVPLPAGIEEIHSGYLDLVGDEGDPTLRQVTAADATAIDYDGPKGYDPAAVLEKLEVPVLWIFGLYDGVIPVRQSIDRIGQLQREGKRNHTIHIFPFGNHNFANVFTGERYDVVQASRAWLRAVGLMDNEHLEELRKGSSDHHARTGWTISILEARQNPPRLGAADLRDLAGRYTGGRIVLEREERLFYRRADGVELELIPLGRDLFGLGELASATRLRFDRTDGRVTRAAFVTATGTNEIIERESS